MSGAGADSKCPTPGTTATISTTGASQPLTALSTTSDPISSQPSIRRPQRTRANRSATGPKCSFTIGAIITTAGEAAGICAWWKTPTATASNMSTTRRRRRSPAATTAMAACSSTATICATTAWSTPRRSAGAPTPARALNRNCALLSRASRGLILRSRRSAATRRASARSGSRRSGSRPGTTPTAGTASPNTNWATARAAVTHC